MIPYLEIIDKYNLKPYAIIEPSECWFELSYYDVGEFEVYARASARNLAVLKKGNYVKLPNLNFIWVITSIQYTFTAGGSRMVSAKGYEAKWLLSKRIIQKPLQLPLTLTDAVNKLFSDNISTANVLRKISNFEIRLINIDISLTDRQAPRGNLLEFINNLLKTYQCGSQVVYENGKLFFTILQGEDKSLNVKFSQSLDNLLSSEFLEDETDLKSNALVVSTIENIDYTQEYDTGKIGIDRSEILISSNLSTKYTDNNGVEQETTPTSLLYKGWQKEEAKAELINHSTIKEVKGEIDLYNSIYKFNNDFKLGDIVEVKDDYFNFKIKPRILKYTISQDAQGKYTEAADYEE